GLADDRAVLDLVVLDRPGPAVEILAVEDALEALVVVLHQVGVRLLSRDFTEVNILPANLAAMRLELDGALGEEGPLAVPEVLPDGVIDHELVVEPDGRPRADLDDPELVPFAERLVRPAERVLARGAGAVVPEAPGPLVRPQVPLAALLGVVPDLNLRGGSQVNAAVGLGDGLVLDEHLDVAVLLFGHQVRAFSVVDQLAVLDLPTVFGVSEPILLLLGALVGLHVPELAGVEVGHGRPPGQVLAVEDGREALGRLVVGRPAREGD